MKIWRVEHPSDGLGAFRSEFSPGPGHWAFHEFEEFAKEFERLPNVPSPQEEVDLLSEQRRQEFAEWRHRHPAYKHYFGVDTEDQLKLWFTPILLLMLKEHGFKLRVYETADPDAAFELTTQVAFCKDQCKLILDHDLTQEVLT